MIQNITHPQCLLVQAWIQLLLVWVRSSKYRHNEQALSGATWYAIQAGLQAIQVLCMLV